MKLQRLALLRPLLVALLDFVLVPIADAADDSKPVKVFILAGQSNMEGQAVSDLVGKDYNDGRGTLNSLLRDPAKAPLVKHLKDTGGKWTVRDDVWCRYKREHGPLLAGPLSMGFSVYGDSHHFGPELQFGHVLGDHFANQVLLIKTAWGGKSLYKDFRPPSSGDVGPYYTKMIAEIREALANLKTDFPVYDGGGYELAGFVWYHGWNDGVDPKNAVPQYERNLVNLINDVRREFNAPKLPVVIGEITGPWVEARGEWNTLRKAQAAAAARPEVKGNVLFVETHDFVRKPEDSPNPGHGHHEFGNAETYFLVGDALGNGMKTLLAAPAKTPEKQATKDETEPPQPMSRTARDIEGWTGRVDDRLLQAQTLDEDLRRVSAAELAVLAREEGDPARGAVVFFQPHMACSKCHSVGDVIPSSLGPDLTTLPKDVSDESLVESVLLPSKVIRKGFESVTAATTDGKVFAGLLVERTKDKLVIRDIAHGGELTTLLVSEIDEVKENTLSIMPAGQVNQIASRQQFLDLIRYLIEIRDGGAARARELQPSPTLLTFTLPEYEQHLDHAALIGDWDEASLQRGAAIYQRVCANCHGTKDQPGSLPTSLRFADGKFKNGSDPLAMYQTLTRGFGLMAAQSWMVPTQKYDVIHYIRETYLRPHNAAQFVPVDAAYLARLPKGDTRGPEPSKIEPWSAMDYGPHLTHTYEVPGGSHNFAYKGIAVRLDPGAGGVSRGRHWIIFDTDTLRVAAAWSASDRTDKGENFIDWRGIQFNGEHQIHPRVVGQIAFANSTGPGWGKPSSGSFRDDQRVEGRDGRRYGPLPRDWAKFRGMYQHGQQVVVSYSVGTTDVLESPRLLTLDESPRTPLFLRTFNIGPRDRELVLQVAEQQSIAQRIVAGLAPRNLPAVLTLEDGRSRLRIPAGKQPLKFTIWTAAAPTVTRSVSEGAAPNAPSDGTRPRPSLTRRVTKESQTDALNPVIPNADLDLTPLTKGGPARWPQKLETRAVLGADDGPFAVDVLTAPESNPWLAQTRFTGLDFFPDGRIAVCSWDGDVWLVENQPGKAELRSQRIASGLFQPLGLKIVGGKIHVTCRDQLAVLHDLNGDGEIDFYECLNNDHQVTEHFHEFAMGLQTDADGNFYYAKSGRHALKAVVPHHGTLLRVSRDGSRTDILATGFRAANGVCLNPDGSFVVTDQEGFWNPKNRINWVTLDPSGKPKFYGNMFGYHDVTDSSDAAMEPPLCWITNAFDRSPAELLWVTSDRWGPLKGSLLNLSYGYGKAFVVPHENVRGVMQGGMIELPLPPFPTGIMRGRFSPADKQLYLCGMFAWAGNATHPGGLFRLRATGQSMYLPVALHAAKSSLRITFTEPLDPASIDARKVHIKTWSLKRTANYGSDHYDEKPLDVVGTALSSDCKTLTLQFPELHPTWCMEIKYTLRSAAGSPVAGVIHNTIHKLAD